MSKSISMKNTILCIALIFTFSIQGQTQNNEFEIIHNGSSLGTLTASKQTDSTKTTYSSQTNIDYHLMVSITIVYDFHLEFIGEELQLATCHVEVRGNERTQVKTVKSKDNYGFYSEGELEKSIDLPIKNTVVELLFEEPIGITKVYSEEQGEFQTIKKVGNHTYLKTASNGHKNTYYYENGVLQKSDVDSGVIAFSMVKK